MKKAVLILCVIMAALCMTGCGAANGAVEGENVITISIAHASSEEATTHLVCEAFAEKAKELLGDRVNVEVYPNATRGSEAEMVEAMQMGTLDAATFGRHSAIDARLDIINLPFLFEDDAHVERVLRGEEGAAIRQELYDIILEHNLVTLGWYETGFREITSNKKIETIDDLAGLLIRTPSSQTLVQSFQAWGASPTAVDLSELYTALQSKVVDAQENPYQLIYTSNFYEVQDYLCVTNHLTIPNQLVFSKKIWDTYPEDVQKALLEAGTYACNVGGEHNVELNNSLMDELVEKMEVTYMDDRSMAEMEKIARDTVWPAFISSDDGTEALAASIEACR